jgi:hypothetical protein
MKRSFEEFCKDNSRGFRSRSLEHGISALAMDKHQLIRPQVQVRFDDVAEVRTLLDRAYLVAVRRRERLKQEIAEIFLTSPRHFISPTTDGRDWFATKHVSPLKTWPKPEFKKQAWDTSQEQEQQRSSLKRRLPDDVPAVPAKIMTSPRPTKRPRTVLEVVLCYLFLLWFQSVSVSSLFSSRAFVLG